MFCAVCIAEMTDPGWPDVPGRGPVAEAVTVEEGRAVCALHLHARRAETAPDPVVWSSDAARD